MCRVFLYSRVSTSQQTLAQQERTAYEWLNAHNMKVDEVVSDEGVSGGVSYSERNLGKVLLPKTHEGDMIIVSEISRLGRSMFDLSKLIHTELKPRKLRLVVVSMGIDLNCAKMTAIDELILNNFSFAAQLEKQLISERTLSALAVKKAQGAKLGSANEKYIKTMAMKSEKEKKEMFAKRGARKSAKYKEDRDTQVFKKVLQNVFGMPDDTKVWDLSKITLSGNYKYDILAKMKDFKDIDKDTFKNWDLEHLNNHKLYNQLASKVQAFKKSFAREQKQV